MKQAMKKSKNVSGIMSLNKGLVDDVEINVKRWVDSAKRQGADIDKMSEQEIKYIVELNKPKPPKAIAADSPSGEIITRDLFNMLDRQSGKNVIKTDFGGGITDIVTETIIKIKTMKPMDAMKEANLVIGRKGKYKNLTIDESQDILKKTNDHIFQRDIKYDEFGEIIKPDPEDFAQGGRTGTGLNYLLGEDDQNMRVPYAEGSTQSDFDQYLKDREQRDKEEQKRKFKKDFEDWKKWKDTEGGTIDWAAEGGRIGFGLGGFNAARRAFLKIMGGTAAGVGVAKSGLFSLLKSGKPVSKVLTSVPIKSGVDGMPVWFKPLVNKVIKEGDDVSKKFATVDREIVHAAELPGSKTPVHVTQDLTSGDVVVDIGAGKHGFADGHLGQPVILRYNASEIIEPTIKKGKVTSKGTKTKDEFWVEEAEFTGGHPENIKFEESSFNKFGEHGSNFDEVEKFATGKIKKKTAKESLKAQRSHWTPEGDMASGGRVPSSGGIAGMLGE